jgi:hypothetical protein
MNLPAVDGYPDTYVVDNELFGTPGALSTYIVDAERPLLLDAGTPSGAERILEGLQELDIASEAIAFVLVSHVHLDHAAGTNRLLEACPNATAVVHERGLPFLTDPERFDRLLESVEEAMGFERPYGDPDVVPADRCRAVAGGGSFDLATTHSTSMMHRDTRPITTSHTTPTAASCSATSALDRTPSGNWTTTPRCCQNGWTPSRLPASRSATISTPSSTNSAPSGKVRPSAVTSSVSASTWIGDCGNFAAEAPRFRSTARRHA